MSGGWNHYARPMTDFEQFVNLGSDCQDVDSNGTVVTLANQSVDITAATIQRTNLKKNGRTYQYSEDYPLGVVNAQSVPLPNLGADTQWTARRFGWSPKVDIYLQKLIFNVAFAMNVSAYTSGNFNFSSVSLALFQDVDDKTRKPLVNTKSYATGMSNLAATGTQVLIVNEVFNFSSKRLIKADEILAFESTMVVATGVGTRQEGILPLFSFQKTNTNRWFSQSGYYVQGSVA